ncbi:imidazole glycerol phosphate synthase subunit HisF [Legionella birminghamensis]|uniref:Imidazole glycerol phosphate synthase subunit HisF n=1 Tax=Legionella birminghamensis TaxID=28083 RepID=A0A378IAP1_9GAMM|nr:imidazole glycerol phosphate synthase subunit HisF [Legionella birminghamensis]KTC75613.1 imidazole glycerol phosphate synthase subunit HisF [Legionella birminghamensis]STX31936.1 imidazoleglycerol-phosphate synthase, cyclase subunit HisF [Legionella birminghamensis]
MLTKRLIPCLDVCNQQVVKGVQFRNHRIIGDILPLATYYSEAGADELVFYDITASSEDRAVSLDWIEAIAKTINIPFTVAGGIRTLEKGRAILNAGADKLSINSPALENPQLIDELAKEFGSQCVVLGIDSQWLEDDYYVFQYTGDPDKTLNSRRRTVEWVKEVQERGAGEIVLNCMQSDGVKKGYDIRQLQQLRAQIHVPLIASGGAGAAADFVNVFKQAQVDGALAASIFHDKIASICDIKQLLAENNIEVRL